MKLKPNVSGFALGGEHVLVIPETDESAKLGVVHSNTTASVIVDCLREETDKASILACLSALYEGDETEMREDIDAVLDVLRQAGVLEE